MFAWKSMVLGLGLMTSVGVLPACQSGGTIHGVIETPLMRITIDVQFYPVGLPDNLDLDALDPNEFIFNGKHYNYYPTFGGVVDPESGQLYQLDDPSWEKFKRVFRETNIRSGNGDRISSTIETKGTGQCKAMWNAVLDPSTTEISISLAGTGDMVLPYWDIERWPSLHRNLFVFPDGIEGSPDPINIEVSGDACDVFSYLVEFGLQEMDTTIHETNWIAIVDEENELVNIFIEDVLLTTIVLSH